MARSHRVIPAQAGIQCWTSHGTAGADRFALDSRLRGNDAVVYYAVGHTGPETRR